VHPTPRNAIDSALEPWASGVPFPITFAGPLSRAQWCPVANDSYTAPKGMQVRSGLLVLLLVLRPLLVLLVLVLVLCRRRRRRRRC